MSTVATASMMNASSLDHPHRFDGFQRSRSAVDVYTSDYDASLCPEQPILNFRDDSFVTTTRTRTTTRPTGSGAAKAGNSSSSKKSSSSSPSNKPRSKSSKRSKQQQQPQPPQQQEDNNCSNHTSSTQSMSGSSTSTTTKRSPEYSSGGSSSGSSGRSTSTSRSSSRSRFGDEAELNAERERKRIQRREQRKREREKERQIKYQQEQIALQQQQRLQQVQILEHQIRLQQQQAQQQQQQQQMDLEDHDDDLEPSPPLRRVTFCIGPDGNIGGSVHWFINENYADLWWQEEELMHTLRACMKTVQELRGVRGREYIKSLTRLYHSYKVTVTEAQTARSLQVVANLPQARGLEQHVAHKLRDYTNKQCTHVLEQQQRLRHPNGARLIDFSQHDTIIRKEAMKHSRPSRQFAFMIAQYDTHAALQASLTSWRDNNDVLQRQDS